MQPGAVSDRIASAHSLKCPSGSTTPMHNTNPEGFDSFRVLLCPSGWHLRGGPRSDVRPHPVPLFGYLRMLFRSISGSAVLSRQLRCGLRSFGTLSYSCSPCRHRMRIVSALRALYYPCPGSPAVFRVSCHTPDNVRSYCATTVRQTARRAWGLQRSCGRLPSSAPALMLCPCSANDAHTICRLRSAHAALVCDIRDRKGKGKGNRNGKCYGKRKGQTFRAPWSGGNICMVFGTKNPYWEMKNRKLETINPIGK